MEFCYNVSFYDLHIVFVVFLNSMFVCLPVSRHGEAGVMCR